MDLRVNARGVAATPVPAPCVEHEPGMLVHEIRVRALMLRPERPTETAGGVLTSTPLVLIDLLTEEGITGRSYVRCYAPEALSPLTQLVADLGSLIAGGAAAPAAIERTLDRHVRLLGPQGLAGIGIAGIDMAAWDALAQARGLPLVMLLGGRPDLGADLATIRAVRAAAGEDLHLMIDYNQSLTVAEAAERLRVLEAEGLYWIEEPTRADDFEGHARLAQTVRTPIQWARTAGGQAMWPRALPPAPRIPSCSMP